MEVSGRKVEIVCEPCGDKGQRLSAVGFCVDCCEFLCIKCYKHHQKRYKHHQKRRAYNKHLLQDEKNIPRAKPDSATSQLVNNGDKCLNHQGEIIRFYCYTDHQFGCGSCMTVNHQKCDEIVNIEEEYEKLDKEMKDISLKLDRNSKRNDKKSFEIEKQHSQAVKDIKLHMKDIKDYFEKLENKMISDVDKVKDEDKKKVDLISATCMTLRNGFQSLTSDLSNLHQSQHNEKLFTMMEEVKNPMKTIAKDIDGKSDKNKILKYTFVPEKQIQDLIRNVTALGKLDIDVEPNPNCQTEILESSDEEDHTFYDAGSTSANIATDTQIQTRSTVLPDTNQTSTNQAAAQAEVTQYDTRSAEPTSLDNSNKKNATTRNSNTKLKGSNNQTRPVMPYKSKNLAQPSSTNPSTSASTVTTDTQQYPFEQRQVSKVSDIRVKLSTDKGSFWVTGIALLPGDLLVFLVYNNAKVRLVYTKQNKIVTDRRLSSKPWDITTVNNNLVAVTLPYDNQIQLMSVANGKFFQCQTIKVKGQCHGIVHNDGTFIVTYHEPAKIEIISMTGSVLKFIYKAGSLFVSPQYIAISPDKTLVYISDWSNQTVTCMTLDRNVKGVYRDVGLTHPHGLTVDKSGSVYVVDYNTHHIHQISGDCSQGQDLQGSGLGGRPWSISYCHKEDKLYVGYDWGHNVKVLQLK